MSTTIVFLFQDLQPGKRKGQNPLSFNYHDKELLSYFRVAVYLTAIEKFMS